MTKAEIYLHVVWTTWQRLPLLVGDLESAVHACIAKEAREMGCDVLAVNGLADPVHVLLRVPPKIAPSVLVKQMKGVSSTLARHRLADAPETLFKWQASYGIFSASRNHVERVRVYIEQQKERHANNHVWLDLEMCEADADEPRIGLTTDAEQRKTLQHGSTSI